MTTPAITNQLYRKKYFSDRSKILTSYTQRKQASKQVSAVFDANNVRMDARPVMIHAHAQPQIKVDTVREGSKITEIRISCPCGRTAEMKVQYE